MKSDSSIENERGLIVAVLEPQAESLAPLPNVFSGEMPYRVNCEHHTNGLVDSSDDVLMLFIIAISLCLSTHETRVTFTILFPPSHPTF